MRLRIAPKIVIRVSTVVTLSASLVYGSVSGGRNGVNTGSTFTNQGFTSVDEITVSAVSS